MAPNIMTKDTYTLMFEEPVKIDRIIFSVSKSIKQAFPNLAEYDEVFMHINPTQVYTATVNQLIVLTEEQVEFLRNY